MELFIFIAIALLFGMHALGVPIIINIIITIILMYLFFRWVFRDRGEKGYKNY